MGRYQSWSMGSKKHSKEQVEAVLRTGSHDDVSKAIRNLPADVDPQLAARVILSGDDGWAFNVPGWRLDHRFPAHVIRAILELLEEPARTEGHPMRVLAIFLVTVVPTTLGDAELVSKWKPTLRAYFDMGTTYGWGSKQKRQKLRSVAGEPDFLRGVQAIAVGCQDIRRDMLAVLCTDGSDESIDALMPHFDRAERNGKRLKGLLALGKHANPDSDGIRSLLDTAEARLHALSQQSPARALANHIGLGSPDIFWFDASCWSAEPTGRISRYQGHVKVDSRSPRWFSVGMTHVDLRPGHHELRATHFDNEKAREDSLGLGVCTAEEVPAWLSRTAKKLDVAWSAPHLRSSVRGKKRKIIEDWLAGDNP